MKNKKYYLFAQTKIEWATLPLGYYPTMSALLSAVASDYRCSRDCYGNDPHLMVVDVAKARKNLCPGVEASRLDNGPNDPLVRELNRGYYALYARPIDVADWPAVRVNGLRSYHGRPRSRPTK